MIAQRITETSKLLRHVGAGNPRLEAELLMAHAIGRPRNFLYTHPDYQMTPSEESAFDELVGRRLSGEPLQYVLGTAAFRHLELRVGPGVLIPRSETEVLVEIAAEALGRWRERWRAGQPQAPDGAARPWVIDVGVGSGAILLSLIHEGRCTESGPWFRPLGLDISWHALVTAAANVGPGGGCDLAQGDLLAAIRADATVAAIVSNPPYVTRAELCRLPDEIREHEPPVALYGGEDGLDAVRGLLDQAHPFIARGALLCFEIGGAQRKAVEVELARRDLDRIASIHPDLAGRPRVVLIEPG